MNEFKAAAKEFAAQLEEVRREVARVKAAPLIICITGEHSSEEIREEVLRLVEERQKS